MSVSLDLVHQDRAEQKQSTANLKGLREEESPNCESPQDRSLNPVATGTGSITSHTTTSPAPAPTRTTPSESPTSPTPTPKPTLPRKKSLSIMSMSMSAFTSTASSSSTRSSNPSIKSKSSESSSSKPPPPPRPRSPPSMYHMYAMDAPRAPKPLVKLPSKESKEGKAKADNHNGSTSTLGTISSFGSHRSSKDKDKGKGTGIGTGLPSIIPAKFGFRRTSSVGRMQAPTPIQNQNQDNHNHRHQSTAQPQPPPPPPESGTPVSPAFPVQSEEEIRKKRIERVERTFGEHVPQELVFPGPDDLPQQHQHQERLWRELDLNAKDLDRVYRAKQEGKAMRRASISVATFASLRKRAASSIASTRTHSHGSSGTSDSHEHEFVPTSHSEIMEERRGPAVPSKTGTTNSVPRPRPLPPVPTGAAALGPRASDEHPETKAVQESPRPRTEPVRFQPVPRQSSLIARTKSLSSHTSLPFAIDASLALPRPSSPFIDNLVPIPRSQSRNGTGNGLLVPPGMELVEGTVVRRERKQGWSGEWNRDDMQDVIQKLRALK